MTGGGNLFYLDREARIAGHEVRPSADLLSARLTRELWIGPCPAPSDPDRLSLDSGEYPPRSFRGRGGVYGIEYFRLAALVPPR